MASIFKASSRVSLTLCLFFLFLVLLSPFFFVASPLLPLTLLLSYKDSCDCIGSTRVIEDNLTLKVLTSVASMQILLPSIWEIRICTSLGGYFYLLQPSWLFWLLFIQLKFSWFTVLCLIAFLKSFIVCKIEMVIFNSTSQCRVSEIGWFKHHGKVLPWWLTGFTFHTCS